MQKNQKKKKRCTTYKVKDAEIAAAGKTTETLIQLAKSVDNDVLTWYRLYTVCRNLISQIIQIIN